MLPINNLVSVVNFQLLSLSTTLLLAEQERYPPGTPGGLGGQFKPKSGIANESEKPKENQDVVRTDYQDLLNAISKVKMSDPRGEVLKKMLSEQIAAATEKASTRLLQDIDTASSKSDLATETLKGTPASVRLSRIADNGKKLVGDIAVVASSAFFGVMERLVEMDTGKNIKDVGEIKEEVKKVAESAISEEKNFLDSQRKGLEKVAQKVGERVANYFKQQRLEGEERWKKSKQILEDTKTVQSSDSMSGWHTKFNDSIKRLANLNISKLLANLDSQDLDAFLTKILSELF